MAKTIVVDHVFKSVAAAGGSLEILHGIDFSLLEEDLRYIIMEMFNLLM